MNFSWLFKDTITNCLFFPIGNPPPLSSNIYPSGIILGSDWSLFDDKTIDGCVFPLFSNFCPLEKSLVQLLSILPLSFYIFKESFLFHSYLFVLRSFPFLSFFFSSKEFQFATKMLKKKKKENICRLEYNETKLRKYFAFTRPFQKL